MLSFKLQGFRIPLENALRVRGLPVENHGPRHAALEKKLVHNGSWQRSNVLYQWFTNGIRKGARRGAGLFYIEILT